MNIITEKLLNIVSDFGGSFKGAFNIREDGGCAGRQSTEHIKIESKKDGPGLVISVLPDTKGETVSIPACITKSNVDDLVYNDFFIGAGADVTIVAGCGIHTANEEPSRHNGIHRFFLGKNSHVVYLEKHVGIGANEGVRTIDPVTEATLEEGSVLEMDTSQIGGVSMSNRKTVATVKKDAKLFIHERLLTENDERVTTDFEVTIEGDGAGVDLISRSVARGDSVQEYRSRMVGNAKCTGHSECDAIISENGRVSAAPELVANNEDAALIHEAAIGKIAGEQILKLRTLGLTEREAEAKIVAGFLK